MRESGHLYAGGYPYSEGIYEDVNKHIILNWYSGRHKKSADAVREWVKSEFCCDYDRLADAILRTETALARTSQKVTPPIISASRTQATSNMSGKLSKNSTASCPIASASCRAAFRELYDFVTARSKLTAGSVRR